jgi:hypothetical protein
MIAATAVQSSSFQLGASPFCGLRKRTEHESFNFRASGLPNKGYQIGNRDSVNDKNPPPIWHCPIAAELCMVAPG